MMYRNRKRLSIRSEVNLTPLIDVMTSLLAIFMITAPLLTTGIPVDLPKGDGKTMTTSEKTLDLSVDARGNLYLASQKVSKTQILSKLKAIVSENPNIQIVISADKKASYGTVIELMAYLRESGYVQVGLKTDAQTVEIPRTVKRK
ncbi:MAG: ExbD/TolR family protein [Alphaproteobacteria bacterium]